MTGTLLFLGLGMQEILFIALIVLLFFGGKKMVRTVHFRSHEVFKGNHVLLCTKMERCRQAPCKE